jgi:ribulose-phosphate 3-epimerase
VIQVAPSILSADFAHLAREIKKVEQGGADMLHIDIMDNHFVPNLTIGPQVVENLRPQTSLFFDVHLMVDKPETLITPFARAGADLITVHAEAGLHLHRLVHDIKEQGIQCGLALNPATPLNCLDHLIEDLDLILIMSVNPGFSGQKFIPGSVKKIELLRQKIDLVGARARIQVDGGINAETAPLVVRAGAEILVAGSFVFNSPDAAAAIARLKDAG